MKKFLTLLLLLCALPVLAEDGFLIRFEKSNPKALAVLKTYHYNEMKPMLSAVDTPKEKTEIKQSIERNVNSTFAQFVDLNEDGIPEIIGGSMGTFFTGTGSHGIVTNIYRQEKNGLKDLAYFMIYPDDGVRILPTKTDGYHDIMIIAYELKTYKIIKSILKYNKKSDFYKYTN